MFKNQYKTQMKSRMIKPLVYIILPLLVFCIIIYWETIRVNLIVLATLKRGILSQNCFWWSINDYLPDVTGVEVYTYIKQQGRFVPVSILGQQIYILTSIRDIQHLLDNSPNPFGPGLFKENFFSTFMPKNVGISVNPEWKYRREYNDKVLQTDKQHQMSSVFFESIHEIFTNVQPKNFKQFTELTRQLTSKLVFGTFTYNKIVYDIFKQADSVLSARFNINTVNTDDLLEYKQYLYKELENPKPNTLLSLANKHHTMISIDEILDQIPHWIFPIAGLFSVHLPRLLVILANHPSELQKVLAEIDTGLYMNKENYIRNCILELFRLNNAVNSTFRGLLESHTFPDSSQQFEKGTQFVFFNNPVLRDLFDQSNQFIPSRWNNELEKSYTALMFNQGNQRCPGKEMVISLLTMGLVSFLDINKNTINTNIILDPNFIPYVINPCTIEFL